MPVSYHQGWDKYGPMVKKLCEKYGAGRAHQNVTL